MAERGTKRKITHDVCVPANIGRRVRHWGREWKIIGINYLGNYDIERYEHRDNGTYRIESSCVLGLPVEHPHYAVLCEETTNAD